VSLPAATPSPGLLEDALAARRLDLDKAALRHFNECCRTQRLALALDTLNRLHTITGQCWAVLCSAVLCCAVLCCAVCCGVLSAVMCCLL
jgi:hypothetical protein